MSSASVVVDAAERILRDVCDPQAVNSAKSAAWKVPAWAALENAGLTQAWTPEELGGAGAGLADGFEILRVAGRFAVSMPLAETLLAGWLLARVGVPVPKGAMSCGPTRAGKAVTLSAGGLLNGSLRAVPYAGDAAHLAVLAQRADGGWAVALVPAEAAATSKRTSIAGEALDDVSFKMVKPVAVKSAPAGLDARALMLMGATVRAMQMAGALEAILDMSVTYANERIAFERAIGKFQAVQHNLAKLAGEVAAAVAAAGSAADAIASADDFDDAVFLEAASAKIRVGEAAAEGARIAHQVHGAIGFTREHTLHMFTRRLWAWRDDFGNESSWAAQLGALVAGKGADGLWPMLAAR